MWVSERDRRPEVGREVLCRRNGWEYLVGMWDGTGWWMFVPGRDGGWERIGEGDRGIEWQSVRCE